MGTLKFDDENGFLFSSSYYIKPLGCMQHYHSLFELYYMEKGSCNYFIDNKSYKIEAGDLVLIPGGIVHKTQYENIEYSRFLINCSKYYIPSSVFKSLSKILYVYNNPDIQEQIKDIFLAIQKDYESPDSFSQEYIRSLIHTLFIMLARNPNKKSEISTKNEYIEKAIEYIQNNFSSKVTLPDVAGICAVSPEHMSRSFKKETGFGFSEYLTIIRLKHAENLLKNTSFSITEIAEQCGFEDSNYFSCVFKKYYGIPPKKLKK